MPKPRNAAVDTKTSLAQLVQLLDATDTEKSRSAGLALVRRGAVEPVLKALATGTPAQRKAAAFLAGRFRKGEGSRIVEALVQALGDEEPKVRKNAAVSLGHLGSAAASSGLLRALEQEDTPWVRTSLVLALGKTGGAIAQTALEANKPLSPEEADATRRALERLLPSKSTVRWRFQGSSTLPVVACVPIGFEDVASSEIKEQGLGSPRLLRPGILSLPEGAPAGDHLSKLRCAFDVRVLLGTGPSLVATPPSDLPRRLTEILGDCEGLDDIDQLFDIPDPPFRYRFSLVGLRLPRQRFLVTLAAVRKVLNVKGWADSPSRYQGQIIVEIDKASTTVWLVPTFDADHRFDYRRQDVGASINPVIGACLARLVFRPESEQVLDPTCGSGSLLIERALLEDRTALLGLDVSPTAVKAAQTNVASADFGERIQIVRSDASQPDLWPEVDEVVANLPFGLRSRRHDRNLEELYAAIVRNMENSLRPKGRAVLYTANTGALDAAFANSRGRLCEKDRRNVDSGGLRVGVYVLERS